jgi:regulator of ribonuclease activity A
VYENIAGMARSYIGVFMDFQTADLSDEHTDITQVAQPLFQAYGMHKKFMGEIVTIKCHEDNSLVREVLGETGQGKVLVVDGGGSLRCALVGDQIATLAVNNGWSGIIIYGCIRDSAAINQMPIGVRALNTLPLKSVKKGIGERNLAVTFAGVNFVPAHYIYADEDGILVAPKKLV